MPRINVDVETLAAGAARQSVAGGELLQAAGELHAALSAAAAAGRPCRRGRRGRGVGRHLVAQPRRARRCDRAHGRQPHGRRPRVRGDRHHRDAALMAGGESYGGITVPEGDPGALETSAGRLRATATVLDTTAGALNGLLGSLGWLGPASAEHASLTQSQGVMATTAGGSMREEGVAVERRLRRPFETPSGFLGLLVRAVALRPRPRHAGDGEIVLAAPRMARLLGGASSEAEPAAAERLSAIAAHWRIELIGSAGWYLEVVDSERGLWSVEDRPGAAVALVPTDPTAVLDQLAALPGHAGLG